MKKILVLILMLIYPLFLCREVNALMCSDASVNNHKRTARSVKYNYEIEDDGYYYYRLKIYGLGKHLAIVDKENPSVYYETDPETDSLELLIYGADNNIKKVFEIRTIDKECYPDPLRTIELNLPKYNSLSDSAFCFNHKNLEECKKLTKENITVSFEDMQQKSGIVLTVTKAKPNIFLYVGMGAIIVVIIMTIYFIMLKKRKNNRGII